MRRPVRSYASIRPPLAWKSAVPWQAPLTGSIDSWGVSANRVSLPFYDSPQTAATAQLAG